jgi:alpha-tubulin suppressor-like RCC1 family protein
MGTFDDSAVPTLVPDAGPWSRVTAGFEHSCGVKDDGTVWCWGTNGHGQLGIEATSFQPAPSPTLVLLTE